MVTHLTELEATVHVRLQTWRVKTNLIGDVNIRKDKSVGLTEALHIIIFKDIDDN